MEILFKILVINKPLYFLTIKPLCFCEAALFLFDEEYEILLSIPAFSILDVDGEKSNN